MFKLVLEKAEEPEIKLPTFAGSWKKQESSRKTSISIRACGSDSKESAYNARDLGLIPGLGRSPGEGNGSPLEYSCLEDPMDIGAWQATVHGVTNGQIQLSDL